MSSKSSLRPVRPWLNSYSLKSKRIHREEEELAECTLTWEAHQWTGKLCELGLGLKVHLSTNPKPQGVQVAGSKLWMSAVHQAAAASNLKVHLSTNPKPQGVQVAGSKLWMSAVHQAAAASNLNSSSRALLESLAGGAVACLASSSAAIQVRHVINRHTACSQ